MRQKTKEMAAAYEETRPLSDGSTFDDNSIVIMRDKHRVQVCLEYDFLYLHIFHFNLQ